MVNKIVEVAADGAEVRVLSGGLLHPGNHSPLRDWVAT